MLYIWMHSVFEDKAKDIILDNNKMPPKKAARSESSNTAAEAHRTELLHWIDAHDELLGKPEQPPHTISVLLSSVSSKTFSRHGSEHHFDWTAFRTALEARSSASPRWFLQLREEDLLCDPDGLEGANVECFVIVEASEPTLAPAHYIVKEHWPNSDAEDNAPERVLAIKDQGMYWRPLTKDDGSSINAFVLSKRPSAGAPSGGFSFGFGAPTSTAQAATSSAPVPAAPSTFGFGTPAPSVAASAPVISFGFGVAATAASAPSSAPIAFGFGAAPAPAAIATPLAPFDAVAAAKAAKPFKPLKPSEIFFVLWSKTRVKDMLKELKSGSRIVQENVKIGADGKTVKLVMQNDMKDDIERTARDLLLNKIFAKQDNDVMKVDKWLDACPLYDETLAPHLQKFRAKYLKECAEDSDVFARLVRDYEPAIIAELTKMVSIRKELVKMECSEVEAVAQLLKEERIADKSTFRVLKYYPENNVLPFRPFGKVSGISETGEHVDFCTPPMYVFKNKLLQQH